MPDNNLYDFLNDFTMDVLLELNEYSNVTYVINDGRIISIGYDLKRG